MEVHFLIYNLFLVFCIVYLLIVNLKSLIEYQITNIKNSVNNINLEESNIILKKTNLLNTIDLLINKSTNKDIKDILYKEKNKLIDDFEII